MVQLLLVAAGGAGGSVCRYLVNLAAARLAGPAFPWGTLAVNIAGSMLMGLLVGVLARHGVQGQGNLRLLLATGFLGGFTTFSAFSLDAVALWERGQAVASVTYVGTSVVLSIGALVAGLAAARSIA